MKWDKKIQELVAIAASEPGMKVTRQLLLFLVLGFVLALGWPGIARASSAVTVYYFHGTARCALCLRIEQMAEEILRDAFPGELANGELIWRAVNVDLPENAHFIVDYDLAANELVVTKGNQTQPGTWNKLPEVYRLVDDPEQFRTQLIQLGRQALARPD